MAVADGRLRDRAGVAMVSRGPGLSNAMVALHSAYHDATPMVVLVGQVERKDFGRLALQEQNYSRLLADVTKQVIEVNEPEQASEAIARAFHLAESGTPGPVAVILPEDIFDAETDAELDPARPRVVAAPRPNDLDRLAEMLEGAERPLVLVGGALLADAVHDNAVFADLNRLAEQWVLPICPTHRRPQLFDATHPNYGGYMGIRVPPDLIGRNEERRSDRGAGRAHDRLGQPVLYLSGRTQAAIAVCPCLARPERGRPRLAPRPRPAVQPLRGHSGHCCAAARRPMPRSAAAGSTGLNAIHRRLLAKEWDPTSDGINFAAVVCEVDKHLAPDATVTTDAGNFGSFVHRYIGFRQGQVFLASVVGAMGSGVPMAVAAALRRPNTQVVAFVGDGGALMSGNEIATALQYGANPIIVISDNSMYGTIGMHSYVRYPERPLMEGVTADQPRFRRLGAARSAPRASRSRKETEVADGIARAFAVKTKPVVVHCLTSQIQMSAWRRYTRSETLP